MRLQILNVNVDKSIGAKEELQDGMRAAISFCMGTKTPYYNFALLLR